VRSRPRSGQAGSAWDSGLSCWRWSGGPIPLDLGSIQVSPLSLRAIPGGRGERDADLALSVILPLWERVVLIGSAAAATFARVGRWRIVGLRFGHRTNWI